MIKNFLTLAFRNLSKRKGYAFLNIVGLAIGVTCCFLILQYVSYERSFDRFQKRSSQTYRIRLDSYQQGRLAWQSATSYPAIGPTLKKDYPEVESFCRLIDNNVILANAQNNTKFKETKGYYADPAAIDMIGIQMLKGDPSRALDQQNSIMLSETTAKKYFGTTDVVGRTLEVRSGEAPANYGYIVSGVFKDYPANSHLIINYLVSYSTLGAELRKSGDTSNATETSFGWYDFYTYIQLKKGTDARKFESKLPAFCNKYMNSQEWSKANNVKCTLSLIPLPDIYLYSNFNQEAEVNGNGRAVGFMFMIGFIIMAIAWINYINLATARSVERGKEVGVRKVLGAGKRQLVAQFMLESLLLNTIAAVIGFVAAYFLSPWFNSLMGRDSDTSFTLAPQYWLIFASLFLFGTLLSGLYPAFVMSAYRPVSVLKGAFKNTAKGLILRKGLIILQFTISVILIAGTIIVFRQVNFMRNQDLGVDINQTLVLNGAESPADSTYTAAYQPFKAELLKLPGVKGIAASTTVPGQEIYWTSGINRVSPPNSPSVTLYHLGIDYDFIPQFGVHLVAGRNFSREFTTDDKAVILNEEAVKLLGFKSPAEAIGQELRRRDTLRIIGVVQSFHNQGLQKAIDPQIILLRPSSRNSYSVKLSTRDMQSSIAAIGHVWDRYFPNDPFNYFFLDDFYNQQYKADQQFGKVFTLFALLAILIACFGLLGLSSYNILQRTKEVGIRKVLGASTNSVVYILSKDFLLLVIFAFAVAVPVAWWLMHLWLQDFAYRVGIAWWVFAVSGLLALL
ncbi:MAG TPA: ABC transporter permease, partial [Chitinophagaceae bacterium]